MQEVELDKNVKLLDCPRVVMVKSANGPLEMYSPGPSMALTYLSILKDCEVHSFKEGLEVKNLRGLHVIGTSLHESRIIDNQVRNPHSIKYNGTVQGLKHIWRTEGLRGLFKGNGTNCARIVPNSAVKFYSYEEASKPINGQLNRDGSATMHEIQHRHDEPAQFAYGRPSKQFVDDEDTENFRSTIFNFSRRASSPESMSCGAYSYSSVKVSVVDEDDCMNEFHRQEDDDDDDEINSSYVIEINSSYRERTDEGVGVDEAITWDKESYQSHSSPEKSSANKTERSAVLQFPDERVDRCKSFRLQEEYPNKMKTDEEQRQIDEFKEMKLLEEDIKLWSWKRKKHIELQLSTLHYVRYITRYFIARSLSFVLYLQSGNSPSQYRGISHALATVLREEGPRALYKGWLPSVVGVVPYVGLNFAVYELLKDWLVKSRPFGLVEDTEWGVTTKLACGAAARTVGQIVAYLLDVIRRRMKMVGWKDASAVLIHSLFC